jgi:ATP-dependent RNA helicase DeaD
MSTTENSTAEGPRFADLGLPENLIKAIEERGYTSPTPVQAAVYQFAAEGRDCVVQARTGTGKTAAFGMPLIGSRVRARKEHCQALILCPTRELALQVSQEISALAKYTELKVVSIYGGAPMQPQITALAEGAHIIVGTPGRVLDHLKRGTLSLAELRAFVLDECDEMLSMGFLPQINDIWQQLPSGQQTLLFSATLPKEVTRIAETRLRNPEFVTLSGDQVGALSIAHYVYLSHGNKLGDFLQIIDADDPESAIVFCNTRDETKRVAKALQERGFAADWLNADLGQSDRERVMRAIRENQLRFLVCTDVAARGIDISHLTHVINFDFPESSEQYVHRTGRTGRAGRIGTAISLVSPTAIGDLYYLRLKYKIHPIERHLPTRQELQTREDTDVVASLSLKFAIPDPNHAYRAIARRLLTHDDLESILTGVLEQLLGDKGVAVQNGAKQRIARVHPGAPPDLRRTGPEARHRRRSEESRRERGPELSSPNEGRRERGPELSGPNESRRERGPELSGPNEGRRERGPELSGPNGSKRRSRAEHYDSDLGIGYQVSDAPPSPEVVAGPTDSVVVDIAEAVTLEGSDRPFVNLYVSIGKRDGAESDHLMEALRAAGIEQQDTGEVVVKARHTYVQVTPEVQELAVSRLNGMEICGRPAVVEVARPR